MKSLTAAMLEHPLWHCSVRSLGNGDSGLRQMPSAALPKELSISPHHDLLLTSKLYGLLDCSLLMILGLRFAAWLQWQYRFWFLLVQAQGFVRTVEQASGQAWQSGVVRSVLGAAFYPQFGHLVPVEQNGKARGIKLLTAGQEKARSTPLLSILILRYADMGVRHMLYMFHHIRLEENLSSASPSVLLVIGDRHN